MWFTGQSGDRSSKSWSKWQRDNWRTYGKAPFITWNNAWYNAPCRNWGAKPGKPVAVNGKKAPPILLISETHDAATPYSGSLELRKRFPRSVLLEGVGATTHSGSLSGIACTDGHHRRVPGHRRAAEAGARQSFRQAV
ncbi:alpha/beta hydrolase [Couchioplanes caeruleus]|uniref:Peptidase S33 tripeptidyl aminopeptidase-like C-terminal domain-containing protein n=1 Tax=Couchioplanes caeruleus subsp. caeruleus TaxID=56427 RepID=A0A1K0GSJ2_9ACTN|nr:alpha/beta hydrolase [Couchioplanes caeruleus]OJF14180.1 hypothetical protein BG844_11015 [Couchioplanes caeruleus subsp. caeruleus]